MANNLRKVYILYDERAAFGDTDRATVLECFSDRFTKQDFDFWQDHDAVLYSYDQIGVRATNERLIGLLSEGWDTLNERMP